MSFKFADVFVLFEECMGNAVNLADWKFNSEDIIEFAKNLPMPEDPSYDLEDVINNLTESTCTYSVLREVKKETRDWIEKLFNHLAILDLKKEYNWEDEDTSS